MEILNAEPQDYSEEARKILNSIGRLTEEPVSQEMLAARVKDFDVLIVRLGLRVTQEVLASSHRLKVIVSATTGLDHIDNKVAEQKGITVLSLQGERKFLHTITATPEHTWTLLLSLMRRVPWAFDDVRRGGWNRDDFRGHELSGKSLGIVGLGRVGQRVARYGLAFGMKVGAYDPRRGGWIKGVRRFSALEDLLKWADVLSIHVPLNGSTNGFLNEERLRLLRRGAWVVNTSRGAVIDEHALVRLLKEGQLSGVATDVLTCEQPREKRNGSCLMRYAKENGNLLITPHLGGATVESMRKTEVFMAKKLKKFLKTISERKRVDERY